MTDKDYKKKRPYSSPKITTEELTLFGQGGGGGGGSCNGTIGGGRKSTSTAPDNCNASKLKT